jgi:hypothetical protein
MDHTQVIGGIIACILGICLLILSFAPFCCNYCYNVNPNYGPVEDYDSDTDNNVVELNPFSPNESGELFPVYLTHREISDINYYYRTQ